MQLEIVLLIHNKLIESFGGSIGIRDNQGLYSALARPYATFDNKELYPTPIDKAAALVQSILINHPFVDGNKRTGYVLMRYLLNSHKIIINASQNEKYEFILAISKGKLSIEEIVAWIKKHSV
jgi:death on curing protein